MNARFVKNICRVAAGLVMLLFASQAGAAPSGPSTTYAGEKVVPYEFRGDLRALSQAGVAIQRTRRPYLRRMPRPIYSGPTATLSPVIAPRSLSVSALTGTMPSPSQNFSGMNFNDSCTGGQCGAGWPPDPNGDVGPNHYIQAVNDAYAIYNKTGTLLASFTENQLWSASGSNPCNGSSMGDPIVLYDQLADRWILTHFAFAFSGGNPSSPFYQCIAVSKTSDPVSGGWWLYPLRIDTGGSGKPPTGTMNDYPKFGIWPDCLYYSANGFSMNTGYYSGAIYASLSRSDLESGNPLTWSLGFVSTSGDPFTMIPSNLLGVSSSSLPPDGTPNYYVAESLAGNSFQVRKFTAGPNCGAGGVLSGPVNVSHAGYSLVPFDTNVVTQPSTTVTLDMIDNRLMQKVQYRNIGGTESLWVVHSVQPSSGSVACPQWAELNVTGGTISTSPVQQQIYCPDLTLHRWLGSLAVDNSGNMALGYSTSNGTAPNYPSIAYSGRLAGDTLNTLPQTETQLVAGLGSQTNICGGSWCQRWGDYSAMSVDPADGCTFWYTNEYYSSQTNGDSGNWQTQIGSFAFPAGCTPESPSAPVVETSSPSSISTTSATVGGNVVASGGSAVTGRGACWDTSANPAMGGNCTNGGTGTGSFSATITGLTATTTYHVRAYAVNAIGTTYGGDVQFTTVAPSVPTVPVVSTIAADNVTSTTATAGGGIVSDGGSPVTSRGVCWSTASDPTTADSCTFDGSGTGTYTSFLTGLTPATIYHLRAYGVNAIGTGYGADMTFATGVKRPAPPTGLTAE